MSEDVTVDISGYNSFYADEYKYVAAAYSITALTFCILHVIIGKFQHTFKLIDTITMVYFLFLVYVNQPINVLDFQKMFGKFHYDYLSDIIPSVQKEETFKSFNKFQFEGFDAFFLNNALFSLYIMGAMMAIYALLKLITCLPIGIVSDKLNRYLVRTWEYDYFIFIFWFFSNQFIVFCGLQKDAMSFNSAVQIYNFCIFLLFALMLSISPFLFAYIISTYKKELAESIAKGTKSFSFHSLISGYKIDISNSQPTYQSPDNNQLDQVHNQNNNDQSPKTQKKDNIVQNDQKPLSIKSFDENYNQDTEVFLQNQESNQYSPLCKYTISFILIRKLAFGLFISLLNEHYIISMYIISAFNVLLFLLYVFSQPHIFMIDNIKNATLEICFIGIQIVICFFNELKQDSLYNEEDTQMKLGWFYISLCVLVLMISLIDIIAKFIYEVWMLYHPNQTKLIKIIPLKEQNNLGMTDLSPQKKSLLQLQPVHQDLELDQDQSPLPIKPANDLSHNRQNTIVGSMNIQDEQHKSATFNNFLASDANIVNLDEKEQYKKRIKPLLFKRNPYIPKGNNGERKGPSNSKTTIVNGSQNLPTFNSMNMN